MSLPTNLHCHRRHRALRGAALAAALTTQVACNGPSPNGAGDQRPSASAAKAPAPAPPPPPPSETAPAPVLAAMPKAEGCGRITLAEVVAALEMPKLKEGRQIGDGPVTVCQYTDGRNHSAVRIYYRAGSTKVDFAAAKKAIVDSKQKPTPIAGLGEMAFSTTTLALDKEFNMVVFLHEGTQTSVIAPAPLPKVKELARRIIAKPKATAAPAAGASVP